MFFMQQKKGFLWLFFILVILSFFLLFLGKRGVNFSVFYPFQKLGSYVSWAVISVRGEEGNEINKLRKENRELFEKLAKFSSLEEENKALRFQFETSEIRKLDLLPAKIVGAPGFIPGKSYPSYFVLDKGAKGGVKIGQGVIFGESVVGRVVSVNSGFSRIRLVYDNEFTEVARIKSNGEEVSGLAIGEGEGNLLVDNIPPSAKIEEAGLITTKGSIMQDGTGFPPGLVLGKIISVEDKKSEVFKKANATSLLNFLGLSQVFIVLGFK